MKWEREKPTEQHQRKRQSVTGTHLLTEPSSGWHGIQSSFVLFSDDTIFDNTLYTSSVKSFFANPHYALLIGYPIHAALCYI